MYAIVEIAGQQFKVAKDQQIFVNRLDAKAGDKMTFDKVLLIDDNGKINLGAPVIDGATVTAKVAEHLKGDKVLVFKKKRRKGYKVKNGYRPYLTSLVIEGISAKGGAKKTATKAENPPAAEIKAPKAAKETTAPKAEASKETKAAVKPKATEETKTETKD